MGWYLILLAFFFPLFLWLARKPRHSPALPPGPRGVPLLGYLPFMTGDLPRELAELARRHGPIFKFYLGQRLCVTVSSPLLVKQIFRDHDVVFANHDLSVVGIVASFGGNDVVVAPYGRQWKKLRRIFVQQILSGAVLDSLYGLRRDQVRKSISHIYDDTDGTGLVDIRKTVYSTTLNGLLSMFWGEEVGNVIDPEAFRSAVVELMVVLGKPNLFELFPALTWLDIQGIEREARRVISLLEAMFDSAIELKKTMMAAKGGERKRKDFLEFLLELNEREGEEDSVSIIEIKGMLMDVMIGGTDTTVATVEWAMAELVGHPEEMEKVQEELAQVVGLHNMVEEHHLSRLTRLRAVVKETLRLHPPFPLLVPRTPSETTVIGGFSIPQGAKIFVNAWAIHRDPNNWADPSEFIPERFSDGDAARFDFSGNDFRYIPFGSGRRICVGMPLADRTANYVLASLLHSFDWKLPAGKKLDMSCAFGVVEKKSEPLIVVPTPRLSASELYGSGQR